MTGGLSPLQFDTAKHALKVGQLVSTIWCCVLKIKSARCLYQLVFANDSVWKALHV
jgi:hypothetical protein